MKKTITQRLNQLKDVLTGSKLKELSKDITELKYSDDDLKHLKLKDKWLKN